ncbi:ATP-binding protein [Kineosporia sp. J2-2]|uniref:ATP-binding protein n=1 Tax=Kineosporia corallincola TaxID=2835133 RepID=A0ABS5TU33_9ACTN|nr:ATP-binding protein [Kineosporia corallincola]MBT0774307.1 ATP-binding protein [Kineosporia corallincola]
MPDGGRIAARGFQYQYLRTLESMLTLIGDPHIASARIEGPVQSDAAVQVDAVDFDVLDHEGRCHLAAQVKARSAGATMSAAEVFTVVASLTSDYEADQYQLLTNATPTPQARQLALALSDGSDPHALRDVLTTILAGAPRRLTQVSDLDVIQMERLGRCRVLFDTRDDAQIRQTLREYLRHYRNVSRLGMGEQSAALMTGYLVSEIFRRAADEGEARFTMDQLREHLLIEPETLARTFRNRDWGVLVGSIPPIPDVARPELLSQIVAALEPAGRDEVRRVILTGLSGIGKSSIAAAFLADRSDSYDCLFWIDAESEDSLLASFQRIRSYLQGSPRASALHDPPTQVRDEVHTDLSRLPGRWALVFDNVGDHRAAQPWIPKLGRGDIIVTSTNAIARYGNATSITVSAMTDAQSADLVARRLHLSAAESRTHRREIQRLTAALANWPLAMELATGYLDSCAIALTDVDGYLSDLTSRTLSDTDSLPPAYPRTLAAALALSIDDLESRAFPEREVGERYLYARLAHGILHLGAFLASRQIPVHLLGGTVLDDLEDAGHSAPIFVDPSMFRMGEVVRELRRYSLVSYDLEIPPTEGERVPDVDHTITMNSVIQALLRDRIGQTPHTATVLGSLARQVDRWLSAALDLNRLERAEILSTHARVLVHHLFDRGLNHEWIACLYGNLAAAYRRRGQSDMAELLLKFELILLGKLQPPNRFLIAQTQVQLIDILLHTPSAHSLTYDEAALKLNETLQYAEESSQDASAGSIYLAFAVRDMLERPLAQKFVPSVLSALKTRSQSILERFESTPLIDTMMASQKAEEFLRDGDFRQAELSCREALASRSLVGATEIDTHSSLIQALAGQEKWAEASIAFSELRSLYGEACAYPWIVEEYFSNLGLEIFEPIMRGQAGPLDLLAEVLAWPPVQERRTNSTMNFCTRVGLFTALHKAKTGYPREARSILDALAAEDLDTGTAEQRTAWKMIWQLIHDDVPTS